MGGLNCQKPSKIYFIFIFCERCGFDCVVNWGASPNGSPKHFSAVIFGLEMFEILVLRQSPKGADKLLPATLKSRREHNFTGRECKEEQVS